MSKDPAQCCVKAEDGTRCPDKPLYKIGHRGFCEKHKPSPQRTRQLTGTATTVPPEDRNGGGNNFCGY